MCPSVVDAKPKAVKALRLFNSRKPGVELRRRLLLRVRPEEDEAGKLCRAGAGRATLRTSLRRRARPAELGDVLGRTRREEAACEGSPAVACVRRRPPGAMAPENTTQYLMRNVYEDMEAGAQAAAVAHSAAAQLYGEALSPRSVYAALDNDHNYESHLAYQQREFEDVFGRRW